MPQRDNKCSAEHGLGQEPRQDCLAAATSDSVIENPIFISVSRQADTGCDLRESAFRLIEILQLRLERLRTFEDARAEELAILCLAELDNVRRQIGALNEEGAGNAG